LYDNTTKIKFAIIVENNDQFLDFLNQDVNETNQNKLTELTEDKVFRGVWNRSRIFFHSNFSTTKRQYLGMSGDFWPKPSKLFNHNYGMSDFNIWFTTDGINRILPKHSAFIIELVFIANSETVRII
jgi:hypothetical protein